MQRLGYQALGFTVWNGGKWYLRRRLPVGPGKLLAGTVAAGGLATALAVGRKAVSD